MKKLFEHLFFVLKKVGVEVIRELRAPLYNMEQTPPEP